MKFAEFLKRIEDLNEGGKFDEVDESNLDELKTEIVTEIDDHLEHELQEETDEDEEDDDEDGPQSDGELEK